MSHDWRILNMLIGALVGVAVFTGINIAGIRLAAEEIAETLKAIARQKDRP